MAIDQLQSETLLAPRETGHGGGADAGQSPEKSEWFTASADDVVAGLKAHLSSTLSSVVPDGPIALVDYPDHSNVGDCAIWLGEMAWIRQAERQPVYTASIKDFSPHALRAAAPEGPILIHGGGNFGTIWMKHEVFRLHLLEQFRGRPIVQMPQSIYYDDPRHIDTMARAIEKHGAFRLLVRDRKSYEFALAHFNCEVLLSPDAAFHLGRLQRKRPASDVVALLREDSERLGGHGHLPEGTPVTDWIHEGENERRLVRARLKIATLFSADEQSKRLTRYQELAKWRLQRGVKILSQGRAVISDRLHAHILSVLLDIPHVSLDNNYGKVSGFIEQWTNRYRWCAQARNLAEADEKVRRLLAERSGQAAEAA